MSNRLTITSLELEGFRVFKGRVGFNFIDGINIIHGPIGSGKSSIIQAIEFALYGNQLEARERVAKLSDLINEESSEASVTLRLGNNMIVRRLTRRGDSTYQSLTLNGNRVPDEEVVALLGIDNDDFERFILVSHKTLEELVYGPVKRRTIAIDRLFGLEFLEILGNVLPIRQVNEAIEARKQRLASIREVEDLLRRYGSIKAAVDRRSRLAAEVEGIRDQIKSISSAYVELANRRSRYLEAIRKVEEQYTRYLYVRERLRQLEEELRGVREEDYGETLIKGSLEVIRHMLMPRLETAMLQDLAERLEKATTIDELLELSYSGVNALNGKVRELEEELEEMRRSREELNRLIERARGELASITERLNNLEKAARQYSEYAKRYGDLSKVKADLEEARARYSELEATARVKASALEVLNYLIREIELHGEATCPVYGFKVTQDKLGELKERASGLQRELSELRVIDVKNRISELEGVAVEMENLYNQYLQYQELTNRAGEYKAQLSQYLDKLQRVERSIADLERRIREYKSVVELASKRLEETEKRYLIHRKLKERDSLRAEEDRLLNELKGSGVNLEEAVSVDEAMRDMERRMDELRKRLEEATAEYMQLDTVLSRVSQGEVDVEKLLSEVKELEDINARFQRILGRLREVQGKVRGRVVEMIQSNVANLFRQLYPYSDLEGITVRLKERRGGGSDYVLYATRGGRDVPISRLSDGQRLTLAQSFVLAVYRLMQHNAGFILMDEPIPYVDVNAKETFSATITKAVEEGVIRQVILATQDNELLEALLRNADRGNVKSNVIKLQRPS
ncbi:AAA family ATPase [Caldivirga sp. MU80]|uniref:AAA family ATPase n=1 Tax=Caldivirga sp. MU80 TaxID=1650354 RepID=UPI000830602B|nr:SMC family ATPase [Caldivirga sp. MU80]